MGRGCGSPVIKSFLKEAIKRKRGKKGEKYGKVKEKYQIDLKRLKDLSTTTEQAFREFIQGKGTDYIIYKELLNDRKRLLESGVAGVPMSGNRERGSTQAGKILWQYQQRAFIKATQKKIVGHKFSKVLTKMKADGWTPKNCQNMMDFWKIMSQMERDEWDENDSLAILKEVWRSNTTSLMGDR